MNEIVVFLTWRHARDGKKVSTAAKSGAKQAYLIVMYIKNFQINVIRTRVY